MFENFTIYLSFLKKRLDGKVVNTTFAKKTDHGEAVGDIHRRGCIVPVGTKEFIIIGGVLAKK